MLDEGATRLATKRLPPLAHNHKLKTVLREIDERGYLEDVDLNKILTAAGNVAGEEDKAIRMIVDANDIENRASPAELRRFMNTLSLEADCRRRSTHSQWRGALLRGLSGGATGLGAGIAAAPALNLEHSVLACFVTTIIGLYAGFRSGMASTYGEHH